MGPARYHVLGADGFGFADTRPAARRFFHIDAQSVVVQALAALADAGEIDRDTVEKAFAHYRINDPTAVAASSRRAAPRSGPPLASSELACPRSRGLSPRPDGG